MLAHAVACPPQWLPLLLASSSSRALATCTPYFVTGDVSLFEDIASMVPAIASLDGVQVGPPVDGPCDEVAAVGVSDGVVRGVSSQIDQGFSVPILGVAGEQIEFRYWRAAEGKEYFPKYKVREGGVVNEYKLYTM